MRGSGKGDEGVRRKGCEDEGEEEVRMKSGC